MNSLEHRPAPSLVTNNYQNHYNDISGFKNINRKKLGVEKHSRTDVKETPNNSHSVKASHRRRWLASSNHEESSISSGKEKKFTALQAKEPEQLMNL